MGTERAHVDASRGQSSFDRAGRCFVLWPHRSLDRRGSRCLHLGVLAGMAWVAAWSSGPATIPIVTACAMTYVGFAVALRHNFRSARLVERIEITPDTVRYERTGPATRPRSAEFHTSWVRVVVNPEGDKLMLRESGRSVSIGEFLSEAEREQLAAELNSSIRQMRAL